jgi:hypothetical protein
MTPTPTDADVERVARAIAVALWERGIAMNGVEGVARAAIAAIPAPDPNAAVRHEYVATLIDRIQRYDATDGRHCDASGANAYELLREAEEALADMLAAAPPAPASEDK